MGNGQIHGETLAYIGVVQPYGVEFNARPQKQKRSTICVRLLLSEPGGTSNRAAEARDDEFGRGSERNERF